MICLLLISGGTFDSVGLDQSHSSNAAVGRPPVQCLPHFHLAISQICPPESLKLAVLLYPRWLLSGSVRLDDGFSLVGVYLRESRLRLLESEDAVHEAASDRRLRPGGRWQPRLRPTAHPPSTIFELRHSYIPILDRIRSWYSLSVLKWQKFRDNGTAPRLHGHSQHKEGQTEGRVFGDGGAHGRVVAGAGAPGEVSPPLAQPFFRSVSFLSAPRDSTWALCWSTLTRRPPISCRPVCPCPSAVEGVSCAVWLSSWPTVSSMRTTWASCQTRRRRPTRSWSSPSSTGWPWPCSSSTGGHSPACPAPRDSGRP